jgi:hypothetical protein
LLKIPALVLVLFPNSCIHLLLIPAWSVVTCPLILVKRILILTGERDQDKMCSSKKDPQLSLSGSVCVPAYGSWQWAVGIAVTLKLYTQQLKVSIDKSATL